MGRKQLARPSRPEARFFRVVALTVIASVFAMFGLTNPPALADSDATLSVTTSVLTPTAESGRDITFTVSWACNSTTSSCTNVTLSVPLPTLNAPYNDRSKYPKQPTYKSATASTGGRTNNPVFRNNVITWAFPKDVPAGTSGQVTFTVGTTNYQTPNGAVIQPSATISADGLATVTDNSATATITASVTMYTRKQAFPAQPAPGQPVTYQIRTTHDRDRNGGYISTGELGLVDAVTTDVLPPGAEFVSATGGGTYDAQTRTVTWPAWSDSDGHERGPTGVRMNNIWMQPPTYEVTVRYPNDTPLNSTVTNTVTTTATPVGSDTPITSTASARHGFAAAKASGAFMKYPNWPNTVSVKRGQSNFYQINMENQGNIPLAMHAEDHLPCTYTSPSDESTTCAQPALTNIYFVFDGKAKAETTLTYKTNLGATKTVTLPVGTPRYLPNLAGGTKEWITWLSVDAILPAGQRQNMWVYGTVAKDLPLSVPDDVVYRNSKVPKDGVPYLENCLANVRATRTDTTADVFRTDGLTDICGYMKVQPNAPVYRLTKTVESSSQVSAGSDVSYILAAYNGGTADGHPIITDLLPPKASFVRVEYRYEETNKWGKDLYRQMGTRPDFDTEVIPNFNNTGRDLVRISWPDTASLPPGSIALSEVDMRVVAHLDSDTPPGPLTNDMYAFDAKIPNRGTDQFPLQCGSPNDRDTTNLSGLNDPQEIVCKSSSRVTVLPSTALKAAKYVKASAAVQGSDDTAWLGPNEVADVAVHSPAQYRLDISNGANTDISKVVAYDILPFVGDTAVGPAAPQARGSSWPALLTGPVVLDGLPDGVDPTVMYSLSTNPCRGEVIKAGNAMADGPANCVNDWTTSVSGWTTAQWNQVKAIRIDFGDTVLKPGVTWSPIINVTAPDQAPGIAWNTFAVAASQAAAGTPLIPVEPARVGLQMPAKLITTKTVADSEKTYTVGDTVTFTITVTDVNLWGAASGVTVADKLPQGLSFVSATVKVGDGQATNATYDPATGQIAVGDLGRGQTATVTLTTRVNDQANTVQICNTATSASDTAKTTDSTLTAQACIPYRATITVTKLGTNCDAGVSTCPLPGSQFALYDTDPTASGATPIADAVTPLPDNAATVTVAGLVPAKDYWLVETKAPAGHELLATPIKFQVSAGIQLAAPGGAAAVDPADSRHLTVTDTTSPILPAAGGHGAPVALTGSLSILIIGGAGYLVIRRRRHTS